MYTNFFQNWLPKRDYPSYDDIAVATWLYCLITSKDFPDGLLEQLSEIDPKSLPEPFHTDLSMCNVTGDYSSDALQVVLIIDVEKQLKDSRKKHTFGLDDDVADIYDRSLL